ncbi:tRNA lysidine(34) synthetase TilS [bacterium]|nr:tRNA lysidine(34) synthetase TilS [bacterium]
MTLTTRTFRRHLEHTFPTLKGHRLLVACSSGADSMTLLHLLKEAEKPFQLNLLVCYVDHRLRKESLFEAELVAKEAEKLHIPFFSLSFDKDFWDKEGNMEERARKERYRLLANLAQKENISAVVTAHHADDQIETLLMRILDRGTGVDGLKGILPDTVLYDVRVIRPLLPFSKEEIVHYQTEHTIPHAEDDSNNNRAIRRNFFRKEIIPSLHTSLGKNSLNHLTTLAQNVQDDSVFNTFTATLFWEVWKKEEMSYAIPLDVIRAKNVNFWISALHKLLSIVDTFGHLGRKPLEDCAHFLMKQEKKRCNAYPLVITIEQDFATIKFVQKNNK